MDKNPVADLEREDRKSFLSELYAEVLTWQRVEHWQAFDSEAFVREALIAGE